MCARSSSPVAHIPVPKAVLGQHMAATLAVIFFTTIQIQVLISAVLFYMLTAF